MTRRIELAKALLRRADMSVTDVCMAVGCTSLGSFSSRFTELVGETPSAYRARDHGGLAAVPACVAKTTHPTEQESEKLKRVSAPSVVGMDYLTQALLHQRRRRRGGPHASTATPSASNCATT